MTVSTLEIGFAQSEPLAHEFFLTLLNEMVADKQFLQFMLDRFGKYTRRGDVVIFSDNDDVVKYKLLMDEVKKAREAKRAFVQKANKIHQDQVNQLRAQVR